MIGLARSSLQYRPDPKDDNALRLALTRLAKQYGRYGYRKIAALLRIEGWLAKPAIRKMFGPQQRRVPLA